MSNYEESDEYCPYCDNHYVSHGLWEPLGGENGTDHSGYAYWQVIDAKTPQAVVGVEGDDARIDSRCVMPLCMSC